MSSAKDAQGVELQRGNGAGTEVFTKVAEVKDISGPDEKADQLEVTSLDSTSKEYIAGLRDGGEVKCEANRIGTNAQQQGVYSDFAARTLRNWKIVCPDGEAYAFAGIVIAHSLKFGTNAARTFSFTVKISGDVTPTYPS